MKNKLLLLLSLVPSIFVAQVGVGTTTVDASAKLQIESTNKGFLQPRVTLTGTADASTIATPATGLMIFNTATAGTGATAVTPGIYYYSGSAWQRVANQAEVAAATTATTTFVTGNLGTQIYGGESIFAPYSGSSKTFGASIALPPGKWEVVLNLYFNISDFVGQTLITVAETTYWLTDDNTNPPALTFSVPTIPTDITADVLFPGGGSFEQTAGINGLGNIHKGSFFINNTTSSNKTYYLFFHEAAFTDFGNNNGRAPIYKNLGGTSWKGNRFYAVKIN
jgi:hypothetical protein